MSENTELTITVKAIHGTKDGSVNNTTNPVTVFSNSSNNVKIETFIKGKSLGYAIISAYSFQKMARRLVP